MFKKLHPYYLFAGCLLLLALFPVAKPSSFHIDEQIDPLFQSFPMQIEGWQGTEHPVDERTVEILETRNILSRIYESPKGEQVHLLLVASEKDRRVAHPPEVCYISSNFELLDKKQEVIESDQGGIPVKSFIARNERFPSDVQRVLYLYKVGNKLTTSYYSQQIQFAVDSLTRDESKILMIRLAGKDEAALKAFLPKVLHALQEKD
ncbi:EpsI family protein [Omnitrophica bacterium]|nr:EpsI family protein [Candidatus Omnitrophota bacterium]